MDKTQEINDILNMQVIDQLNDIKKKYKKELLDFIYIENEIEIISLKYAFIRYVGINGLLYYGGIYYKCEKINNDLFILLINKNKKPWKIKVNNNYIFYKKYNRNINDSQRELYSYFLEELK